ncbi:MAG TPA: hypothetical protein VM012_12005 [Flavitalea sp.]|nr:hypothetical protein [Flavitalea sp.]
MNTDHPISLISPGLRINKFLPVAALYFFVNSIFLPQGLLYTTLLTPFFIVWLYNQRFMKPFPWFFFITIVYACIHLIIGVELTFYIISYILFFCVFVFCCTFYQFTRICSSLRDIFRQLLILNFLLLIPAVIAFFIPDVKGVFWMTTNVSSGLNQFSRLKMFTYEASYYSMLLVPIALYYYIKMLLFRFPNKGIVFFMITLPIILSFSFGTMLGLPLSLLLLFISDIRLFSVKPALRKFFLAALIIFILLTVLFIQIYPDNPLFLRIANIFSGRDSSFRGRVFESFYLAFKAAEEKSLLFGCGLGQFKVVAKEMVAAFYHFTQDYGTVRLPSSVSETMVTFGITGLVIRIGAQIYLFFRTKVHDNYYRLALFIFIFIYQFTGSFLFNIAEFVIWILAFAPVFGEFDKSNVHSKKES